MSSTCTTTVTRSLDDISIDINAVVNTLECNYSSNEQGPQFPPLPLSGTDNAFEELENSSATTSSGTRIMLAPDDDAHHRDETSSNRSTSTAASSVKFDKVTIRSYNMTIADNPSCTSGIAVGLSWEYDPQEVEMSVEAYESSRDGNRRSKSQMLIPRDIRVDLLREFNVSMREIFRANDEVERAQRKRMKALSQPRRKRREMVDRIIKTANRGFRKVVESNDIT